MVANYIEVLVLRSDDETICVEGEEIEITTAEAAPLATAKRTNRMEVKVLESCCAGPGKGDIYEGEIVELDDKIAKQLILMGRVIEN